MHIDVHFKDVLPMFFCFFIETLLKKGKLTLEMKNSREKLSFTGNMY